LKHATTATTTTEMQVEVAKVRAELKTFGTADHKCICYTVTSVPLE